VFSSTYDNYRIIGFWNTPGGTTGDLTARLRVSGADTSTNYIQQRLVANNTTIIGGRDPFGQDEWFIGQGSRNGIGSLSMDIMRPNVAATTGFNSHSGSMLSIDTAIELNSGTQTANTQFTGISFLFSQSNTGSIIIYGYQKA